MTSHLNRNRGRRQALDDKQMQRGTSLIEVMVSVLVLAIGLLGIAAMQATALRNSGSSLGRSQAVIQSYAALDAMRGNRTQALAGGYNMAALECTLPTGAAGGNLATNDINRWITDLKNALGPDACGRIECAAGAAECQVTIRWDDSRASETAADGGAVAAGAAQSQLVTRARL
ncbi:type IV pilus modification protein PilV [Luteimonas sp. RIT-PG2_3]